RGAAFLSGVDDGVVVDVGGTTADVGVLVNGFPREASTAVDIGGVSTNFRMPDVLSLGLGGGSLVRGIGDGLTVGPDSVGFELPKRALVFGGNELTATDIAVAAEMADIGDASLVSGLDDELVRQALQTIQRSLAEIVEQMKTSAEPVPVVVVGGGGVLVDDELEGASTTIRPDNFAVANAIGAAIAQVGAETDHVYSLAGMTRDDAVDQAKQAATDRAIAAGAEPSSVEIVDADEIPLAYLPSNAIRIRVKAVGDLSHSPPTR
ncbi:MAG: hydantoinase/oxoprolinase family protein, partial [Actinomycetota bacterium]|nr:hydantoinase/oxoprolinase family protein [Actinomycetota bacterium]